MSARKAVYADKFMLPCKAWAVVDPEGRLLLVHTSREDALAYRGDLQFLRVVRVNVERIEPKPRRK